MAANKNKIFIPIYQMERNAFYLLLRVRMEIRGVQNINGVDKDFFSPETYQNSRRILTALKKRNLIEEQEGNILIKEGLEKALDKILDSPHCMNFQNAFLHKKEQILTFYYADGSYVGVLLDKKDTTIVVSSEEEVLYNAFERQLEDKSVSKEFRPEHWNILWRNTGSPDENKGILQPVREARITHSGNRSQRENFNTAMVADSRQIQIIRGTDSLPFKSLNRETVSAQDWYGVICHELTRLKAENRKKSGDDKKTPAKEDAPGKKSEYQQIISTPDFPKSRTGFLFWSLKRIIMGFPKMILGMIKRKSLALLLYPLWAALLFFYNMYMTCYYNDTFMLDRRSRFGNLSPYLMAGTLRTPSSLKGLQMNWGLIDTSFLVWPLMMLLTLLLRQVILQFKQRKFGFFADLFRIPASVRECSDNGFGKGRSMWIILAVTWIIGFVIMNPITIFLCSLLLLLMFAQGAGNGMVQLAFLWECAGNRKKIDAGLRAEPDRRKYRIMLFHGSMGMGLYGLVSLLLWIAVDYSWWIRLVVTALMVLFALMQVFMPGAMSGRFRFRATAVFLLFLMVLCVATIAGGSAGIVLADDGGWTESGRTLAGLLQNAGFSTILGISLLTIGLALGLPLVGVGIASLIIGGGTFFIGLTDTKAGDYVRKSSRQYFFGPDEGENKTLFCTATELLNFVSGFVSGGNLTGAASKVFQSGKLVGDIVSTAGDFAAAVDDYDSYVKGSGDVGLGDLLLDCLGLGLDFYGMKGDYGEFKEAFSPSNIADKDLRDTYDDLKQFNKDGRISDLEKNIDSQKQADIIAERNRHTTKINEIENDIQRLQNGKITPPKGIDQDTYLQELKRSLKTEDSINAQNLNQIEDTYKNLLQNGKADIINEYAEKQKDFYSALSKELVDKGSVANDIKGEFDNLKEFFTSNGFIRADGEKTLNSDGLMENISNLSDEELSNLADRLREFIDSWNDN